jgi:hypothetical protein
MAVPHADDSARPLPGRPHQHHQPPIEPADGAVADLTVVAPVVHAREVQPGEDLGGAQHIEAAPVQGLLPLYRIAGNAHG